MKRKRRGVRKKINGNVYAAQVQRLESVLVAHMQELSLWQDTVGHKREREQILLDMILHQELMLQLLQAQQAWLASNPGQGAASSSSSSRAAPQQPWVTQWAGGPFRPNESTTTSYIASLLLAATPAQLLQAIEMTSDSWSQYKHDHFQRLAVLLELLTRQENFSGLPSEPVAAAEAAAAVGESLQVHPAALLQAPAQAAAGSSLPSGGPAAAPELQELDVPGQLDEVVDEGLLLSFLSLFHNHLMLIQAAMNRDLSGNTPTDAPPSHWRHVVRRVNLTERQLLHMRLATEEFERLSQSASAEAGDLVLRAACPSLYLAAEAQQRLRAGAASGDGSPASSFGAGDGQAGAGTSSLSGSSRSHMAAASGSLSEDSSERGSATPLAPGGGLPLSSEDARAALAKAPAAAAAAAAAGAATGRGRGRGRRSSSSSATTGLARVRPAAPATPAAGAAAAAAGGSGAPPEQQEQQAKESQQADREGQDALQEDLQRHVRHRFLHMLIMGMFCFNTLSRVQIARMTVYCYPYYPDLVSFAAQAAEEHKQRTKTSTEQQAQPAPQQPQPQEAYQVYEAQQLERHMQRRSQLLEQQQQLWLEQLGEGDRPGQQQPVS